MSSYLEYILLEATKDIIDEMLRSECSKPARTSLSTRFFLVWFLLFLQLIVCDAHRWACFGCSLLHNGWFPLVLWCLSSVIFCFVEGFLTHFTLNDCLLTIDFLFCLRMAIYHWRLQCVVLEAVAVCWMGFRTRIRHDENELWRTTYPQHFWEKRYSSPYSAGYKNYNCLTMH